MGSVTSSLIISLIDKVSGPAKGAAAALKGVAAAEKSLAGASGAKGAERLATSLDRAGKAAQRFQAEAKNGLGWGATFQRDIDKLKLTSREIEAVRRDYERLQSTFRGQRAGAVFDTLEGWKTKTISNIHAVRRAEEDFARHQKHIADRNERMARGVRGGISTGLGIVGAGSGVYAVQRTARASIKASAVSQRESARDYLAGMPASDTARISKAALESSTKYQSVDAATMHERLRDTAMSMRSTDKAIELSDTIAQGTVVLQSLKGKEQAIEEGRRFFSALDVLGKNIDPKEVKSLFNGYIKALSVEGADMNLGGVFTMAKRMKSAGATVSDRFLMTTGVGLGRDMGDDRAGNAIAMMMQQEVQAKKGAIGYGVKTGLRSKDGKFVDRDLMMHDPDLWAWKNITAAMERAKLDPGKPEDVNTYLQSAYSNSSARDVISKLMTQRAQYEAKAKQYDPSPGLEAAGPLAAKDPFVALEGVMSQLRNFATQAPVMDAATAGLNGLSGAIANLTKELAGNKLSTGEKVAAATAVGGGTAGVLGLGAIAAKGVYGWFTGANKVPLMEGAESAAKGAGGKAAVGGRFLSTLLRAYPWAMPLMAATRPDIVEDPGLIAHLKKRVQEAEAAKASQGSYGRDFTLGYEGGFSKEPSIVPPGGFKHMTEHNASHVAPGELSGQLDKSAEASAAGANTGSAWSSSLDAELSKAKEKARAAAMEIIGILSFTASPTISPKVNMPSAPGGGAATPGKQSAAESLKHNRHAAFADGLNFGSFA